MHRRSRGAGPGIAVLQPVILRLLELFLRHIQGQPIMIGLQVPQVDGDVFPAHAQEGADIDDHRGNLPVTVEAKPNTLTIWDAKGSASKVTIQNVFQSNGVIHVVDTVLLPSS